MKAVRIVVEYRESESPTPSMRWERTADAGDPQGASTFELLGRAFEVALREEGAVFGESLTAFFKGAMLGRQDIAEILPLLD